MIAVPAKTFSLIAYLLLNSRGEPANRASLRQFFWGNADAKTAATNLRKFLWRLGERQEQIGFELVRIERNHVALAGPLAQIDLARFRQIVSSGDSCDLVALCDIYRGDLLEGIEMEDADFGTWLQVQRADLRDALIGVVLNRLEPMDDEGDRVALRVAARRVIEVDPYNEIAHRALMRLFAEDGEPARVRDVYRSLELRLRKDLGVDPDIQTTSLYHALVSRAQNGGEGNELEGAHLPVALPAAIAVAGRTDGDAEDAAPRPQPNRSGMPRITILPPPQNGGQDYGQQLVASLVDDITIGLCRFKALSVVAPHTAWELTQDGGRKALLRSFKIDYCVETYLQNHGDGLRFSVKLINALSRDILWIEQFRFDVASMARQYRELSVSIVLQLVETVERLELSRYDTEPDATAYHAFLSGQKSLRTFDLPAVRRARRAFKTALGSCADFAPAMNGLAHTFHLEWLLMARGDSELLSEAERLAKRSLEIDPDDARGYRNLGLTSLYTGRFDESLEAFAHAEKRNPQYADLLVDYADALQHACEPATALQKVQSAIELNPLCPDDYWWVAGGANFHLQRYRDAVECMAHMRDKTAAFRLMAASHAMLGERDRASEFVRRAQEIHPDFTVSSWLSIVPIKDPKFAQHYEHGLREAGFK